MSNIQHAYRPFRFKELSEIEAERALQAAQIAAELEVEEPLAPSFDESELEAAKEAAFAEGVEQGRAEAQAAIDAEAAMREEQLTTAFSVLTASIAEEVQAYQAQLEEQKAHMVQLAVLMAKKMTGKTLAEEPLAPVMGMIDECVTMFSGEGKLAFKVHPDLVKPLEKHLKSLEGSEFEREVIGCETVTPGSCKIRWPGGEANRDQEALWQEIETMVTRGIAGDVKAKPKKENNS